MSLFQKIASLITLVVLPALVAGAPAVCRPAFSLNTASIAVSSDNSKVWSAHLEGSSWSGISIVDASSASAASTGWNVTAVNGGNANAFYLGSLSSPVCAGGDGGPLDPQACPTVTSGTVPAVDQFFITCATCGPSTGSPALSCQFQSANEGQCAAYSTSDSTVRLEDCDNTSAFQLFDILVTA